MKSILRSIIALSLAGTLFTSCKKDCTMTPAIIVNAGPDQIIQLPANSATLTGTVTSGKSPTLVYLWDEIAGPSNPVITNGDTTTASVNNLVLGTYVFRFQAENSAGTLIGLDTVTIRVIPANTQTVILQPSNNPLEVSYRSNLPTTSVVGDSDLGAWAWTISGSPTAGRFALQFDLSGIPGNAVITSAKLYLYATPFPPEYGDKINSDFGTANACYIQRITTSWTAAAITWNTPPATTFVDEATIPQSTSSAEDDSVDVTALLNDIQTNGNYGFAIQLQNETPYNIRQYASSFYSNAALHPKLVITY